VRFNLKNRPVPPKFHTWKSYHEFLFQYVEWVQGFEKELNYLLDSNDHNCCLECKLSRICAETNKDGECRAFQILREILGE